ncbi:MAG: TfuA-like protein [Pseudomonadota bacterium]
MKVVFAGPSTSGVDLSAYNVDIRGPVRQGDVWRAIRDGATAVGIIDGYFEGVPSVWHKEILWALSEGIPVLGASSMGALRAAEMDAFGMIGVGAIYEWYRDGVIEDDDEVALVHGPAEIGSPALSVPMVNVRATCAAAEAMGMDTGDVITVAKAQFYKGRTWDSVLTAAALSATTADWLRHNEVDQKRLDALALLELIGRDLPAPSVEEPFENTSLWVRATEDWGRNPTPNEAPGPERLLGG